MARSIYVFKGDVDSPDLQDPEQPISRDDLIDLFEEKLEGIIRYRVLGKYYYTHNNVGLEANLKFETMPCIRFDLRKTGVQVLIEYLEILSEEFDTITVINPEQEQISIHSDSEMNVERLESFLWPQDLNTSIEI